MVRTEQFKQMALSFPGTEETPHFDRTAFKVKGRKNFATLHEKTETANICLPLSDQAIYCSFDETKVYPVPNKYSQLGWTTFELKTLPEELVSDALLTAYNAVLKTKPKRK